MPVSKHTVRGGKSAGTKSRPRRLAVGKLTAKGGQRAKPAAVRGPLVGQFFDRKGIVVVERIAKRFGMSKQQFAETIGVAPETVYRATRVAAPKTQTRATEMLEIVGRIADWAGGERQAMAWYRAEPIAAFGGRTAESLVKEGRAAAVRDYLDHVATGGFA
ncbi:MAG TPA: MbcA/ParS/Xre antitoxin family protein [Bradyrhizobium sp.]|nr:MbcA/ParS/Xre antitoxin family protein [Bradyrhizobium sp.]